MTRPAARLSCLGFLLAALVAAAPPLSMAAAATAVAGATIAGIHGKLRVPGLRAPVRVQRDRWGVPHIYATNQHDLFFAQGFVVAQDRLFQMELWKRSGQGRLAEILGPSAVERDINARRLLYRGDTGAEFASYAPDARAILEDFTSGINAYIDAALQPGSEDLPKEFGMAGFAPEHWRPEDCLNRLAAYSMTGNAAAELQHAAAVSLLGATKAGPYFEFDPAAPLEPAPGANFSGLSAAILENIVASDQRIAVRPEPRRESNDWTVAGSLTATGKPLLANDPHRVVALPSLRYIVHLVAPGWNVIGAGEPGLPGVAAGHNEQIAWGFTIFGLDQQDLYLETLDPADPERYASPDGWRRMETRLETIRVRGSEPVDVRLRFTRHGPVLWQDGTRALALRWVGSEPGTAGYLGSLALDRATDWRQFEATMPRWKVPSENIVYADRAGNIGEHSTGLAPIRKNWTGLLPVPGDGAYEWSGFVPTEELPHSFNPAAGFIATANQKMIPDNYAYAVGYEWAPPVRFLRATELLQAAKDSGHKLTVRDMEDFQLDVVSRYARDLQRLLRAALADAAAAPGEVRAAAEFLLSWDCALRGESPQAALFEVWTAELRRSVTRLAVPEAARAAVGELSVPQTIAALDPVASHAGKIEPVPHPGNVLLEALAAAQALLAQRQGGDMRRWSWGRLHQVRFRHPLDELPGGSAFDPLPAERPGDDDVLQATGFDDDSFDQTDGASYREIFDLDDWDRSRAINVPGQSGRPGSRHYDDLLPLWRDGRYFPLLYSKAAVDRATTDRFTLLPAPP